jgi:hypothetical protein
VKVGCLELGEKLSEMSRQNIVIGVWMVFNSTVYTMRYFVHPMMVKSPGLQSSTILHIEGAMAATRHQSVVSREHFPCPDVLAAVAWGQSNSEVSIHRASGLGCVGQPGVVYRVCKPQVRSERLGCFREAYSKVLSVQQSLLLA